MATKPKPIRGGKVRVLLGDDSTPVEYVAPCGFTQRSITLSKGLEDILMPNCDDPDAVPWQGRDATSLSISVSGEGILLDTSVETWLDAYENTESTPAKIEWEFPDKTITWTGFLHIETVEVGATDGRRVTLNVSMQSDGEMVRVVAP
ncbi:phage tail tube protein [Paenochrobactrum sp. BZR 201-1]